MSKRAEIANMETILKAKSNFFLHRASRSSLKLEPPVSPQQQTALPSADSFEVKVSATALSKESILKITKAMRKHLETISDPNSGHVEMGQAFAVKDITTIKGLSNEALEHAYLEGVYVAERYCALVDPGESAVQSNAKTFMAEYLHYMHHKTLNQSKIEWVKKDYYAGTAGEDVEADAKLVVRAQQFRKRVQHMETQAHTALVQKQTRKIIEKDTNPLAAFIALRRACFIDDASVAKWPLVVSP